MLKVSKIMKLWLWGPNMPPPPSLPQRLQSNQAGYWFLYCDPGSGRIDTNCFVLGLVTGRVLTFTGIILKNNFLFEKLYIWIYMHLFTIYIFFNAKDKIVITGHFLEKFLIIGLIFFLCGFGFKCVGYGLGYESTKIILLGSGERNFFCRFPVISDMC